MMVMIRRVAPLLALVLAACTGGAGSTAVTAAIDTPGLPVTFTGPDGVETTVESAARIVTLSGDYTEIVFALGLGDSVVGVDLSSVFPSESTMALPKIGIEFAIFAEPILDLEPTVVIGDTDAAPASAIEQIRRVGVPVVIFERRTGIAAPGVKIREVANALGIRERGEQLAGRVEQEIAEASAIGASAAEKPRVAIVYVAGGGRTVLLLGEGSVADGVFEAIGAVDASPMAGADGYVPLTAEAIVNSAPDVIITGERGIDDLGGIDGFLAVPGIAQTPAGRDRRVLVYEDLYLLGLGPRTGALVAEVIGDLHPELTSR